MTQESERYENIRVGVLDRMERGRRMVLAGMTGAAVIELLLIVGALLLIDWSNRTQILIFVLAVLSYSVVVLGLVALAGHVTRSTDRILAALDAIVR